MGGSAAPLGPNWLCSFMVAYRRSVRALPVFELHHDAFGESLSHVLGRMRRGIATENLTSFAFGNGAGPFL
jgi:hypothetical protein